MINRLNRIRTGGYLVALICILLTEACSMRSVRKTPDPGFYGVMDRIAFNEGYSRQRQPWIVFSDRDKNKISQTIDEDPNVTYQEAAYLEPFLVLKHRKGMFKLAEYKPGMVNNGKRPKMKALKVRGWIPEDHLLLWTNGLRDRNTGFVGKAAVVINSADIMLHAERYLEQDSVLTFTSPDLVGKTTRKLDPGSIAYIYKQSEDQKRVLIGGRPGTTPDSLGASLYGWVSKGLLSVWGERASAKICDTTPSAVIKVRDGNTTGQDSLSVPDLITVVDRKDLSRRSGLEHIFPIPLSDTHTVVQGLSTRYFTNVLDYEKNKIYNVLGNTIWYNRYREIIADNRKLNIIFVLDVSYNNRLYLPVAKSLLQELQLDFTGPSYFSTVRFGGVAFRQNNCGEEPAASLLSGNYRDVARFFEDHTDQVQCRDTGGAQPVGKALHAATQMLSGAEGETNLIILIGTTADQSQAQSAINAVTKANARLICFQSLSRSADAYNDFVLLAEKTVVNSARNIAEMKKEKIVNQNDLLTDNGYNLNTSESGVYALDYPSQSMTQGFVIFPKKGETMQARVLKRCMDSLIHQVTADNRQVDSSLTAYFRSGIGVNNTWLAKTYEPIFPEVRNAAVPVSLAASLLHQQTAFLVPGTLAQEADPAEGIERGMLLNEQEYDQLRAFYTRIAREIPAGKKFRKRKAMRQFVRLVAASNPSGRQLKRRRLRRGSMAGLVQATTGFPLRGDSVMNLSPRQWKRSKAISRAQLQAYFGTYRTLGELLSTSRADRAIVVNYKGQIFYWLNAAFIPQIP